MKSDPRNNRLFRGFSPSAISIEQGYTAGSDIVEATTEDRRFAGRPTSVLIKPKEGNAYLLEIILATVFVDTKTKARKMIITDPNGDVHYLRGDEIDEIKRIQGKKPNSG